ncbi:homeobox protein 5-like [Anopheles albimanus]|uniref:RRM domain-containing protein n=1 Tax=Anopheles albimanus TaxID=7167 RepID=A0A182FGD4_ANOAL|nr:homeobox protein 5-like [Anopheles albimanus]
MSVYGSSVQPANVSVIIRLQNLPLSANASDVRAFLAGLAIPDGGVHIVGGERGDAFIAFSNDEDARQAIFRSGRPVKGVPVSLQLSSRAEMQKVIEEVRRAAQAYELQSRGDDEPLLPSDAAVTAAALSAVHPNILASAKALSAVGGVEGHRDALSVAASSVMNAYGALATAGSNVAKAAQLQPPIISLTDFLGGAGVTAAQKAVTKPSVDSTKPSPLVAATVAPVAAAAAATATAAAASTVSPLALPGGSSYQEIPGLSLVGGSAQEASSSVAALSTSGIASWLSAISEQLQQTNAAAQQRLQPAAITATTPIGPANGLPSNVLSATYGSAVITNNMNSILTSNMSNTIVSNNSTMPFFGNGQQPIVSEGPWKTLERDSNRRSRSPSPRDRHDNRRGQGDQSRHQGRHQARRSSRSSSRERRRRSLSSSRERGDSVGRGTRKFRSSRSSSRERWSRSSSREPPSAAAQRQRQRRSRSTSRDRFGRTRSKQRSRSRSRDRHRSSRDSSRERGNQQGGGGGAGSSGGGGSGGGTRDSARSRWNRPERSSRFSDRDNSIDANSNPSLQQWNSFNNIHNSNSNNNGVPFTGSAEVVALQQQPVFAGPAGVMMGTMNQVSEPIFGLHTMTALEQQQRAHIIGPHGNMIPARSGKITPPPSLGNGGTGGMFRSNSPLPESVYTGRNTSDYAVRLGNLDSLTGYGDIRRFFHSHTIATQGIKMINDDQGRRTGVAYVQFSRKDGKRYALQHNGTLFRQKSIQVESITDQEFEQAIDSYRPNGVADGADRRRGRRGGARSRFDDANNDEVIEIDADQGNDGGRMQRMGQQDRERDLFETTALKVRNLPTLTTEQDIMKMFSDFTVVEVLIVRNHAIPKQLDGYIRFHRQEDAREAWSQTHRHYITSKRVVVRMCSELDYAVAKNEYENPVEPQQSKEEEEDEEKEKQQQQKKTSDRDRPRSSSSPLPLPQDDDVQIIGEEQGPMNFKGMRSGGDPVRDPFRGSTDWNVEKNWDEEEENMAPRGRRGSVDGREPDGSSNMSHPQQGIVGRDPRLNRDPRMNRFGSNSDQQQHQQQQNQDRQNNGIETNNLLQQQQLQHLQQMHLLQQQQQQLQQQQQQQQQQHDNGGDRWPMQHDPRRMNGNSNDSSELFQRTNCLLLRNVKATATEQDVYEFFEDDGFRAKNVQLVTDEWGCRTGEAVVQFDSASEAAHAESKSSQMLAYQTVFASHLDRGQVAELMQRFQAQEQKRQENQQRHARGEGSPPRSRLNGGRGSENDDDADDPRSCMVGMLNLAYKTTVEDVQRFFRDYRVPLDNIKRLFKDNGKPTGEALVRFRNPRDARRAIRECNNQRMFGRNVRLRIVDDTSEPRSRKGF